MSEVFSKDVIAVGASPLPMLDELFGELVEPNWISEKEKTVTPLSLQELSEISAVPLQQFMQATASLLGVTAYVYCELPILWVVNDEGKILIAVEEIVEAQTVNFKRPRLRDTAVDAGFERLGHPALVQAKSARIGGEILFDVRAASPHWIITNGSGRYGLLRNRKSEQLEAVVQKFSEFGISLKPYFLKMPGVS